MYHSTALLPRRTDAPPKAHLNDDGIAVLDLAPDEDGYAVIQLRADADAERWLSGLIEAATVLLDAVQRRREVEAGLDQASVGGA